MRNKNSSRSNRSVRSTGRSAARKHHNVLGENTPGQIVPRAVLRDSAAAHPQLLRMIYRSYKIEGSRCLYGSERVTPRSAKDGARLRRRRRIARVGLNDAQKDRFGTWRE